MPLFIVPLLLIALPIAEITAFILVGGAIGVLPTIGLVVLASDGGAALLRVQGFGAMSRIRQELDAGRAPGQALAHGAMIMLAGILLIIPGFVTDFFGLLLFIPPVRELAWRFLRSRMTIVTGFPPGFGGRPGHADGKTIDLDADDYSEAPDPKSPWRRIDRD